MQKHWLNKHMEELGIGNKKKLDELYREYDATERFDILKPKQLVPVNRKSKEGPWVNMIYKLKDGHGTQAWKTQLRHCYKELVVRKFVLNAAIGVGGARTSKSRKIAKEFQEYIIALDKVEEAENALKSQRSKLSLKDLEENHR